MLAVWVWVFDVLKGFLKGKQCFFFLNSKGEILAPGTLLWRRISLGRLACGQAWKAERPQKCPQKCEAVDKIQGRHISMGRLACGQAWKAERPPKV